MSYSVQAKSKDRSEDLMLNTAAIWIPHLPFSSFGTPPFHLDGAKLKPLQYETKPLLRSLRSTQPKGLRDRPKVDE